MHKLFQFKSLAFYGGSIATVVVLFSFTTTYGETNLQAPKKIDGLYVIPTENLPECLSAKPSALIVQQSGVYLTGAFVPADANEQVVRKTEEHPVLVGSWNNGQFIMEGSLTSLPGCQGDIKIQGAIAQEVLKGTLSLSSEAREREFTATRKAPPPLAKGH
jgi:hypothetical protein